MFLVINLNQQSYDAHGETIPTVGTPRFILVPIYIRVDVGELEVGVEFSSTCSLPLPLVESGLLGNTTAIKIIVLKKLP